MRIPTAFAAFALLAAPAYAAPAPPTSWGRAGVGFDEYRADAARCLRAAETLDVAGTEPANALVRATTRIDNLYARVDDNPDNLVGLASQIAAVEAHARPERRIDQIRELMQAALEQCLAELGYRRFRLTEAQRERLRRLRSRAPARHAYLHSLASNPRVLAAQAVQVVLEQD